jgi:ABC-type multidrug transport system fused ATPase/permease subunit
MADLIVVLKDGTILERGTHADLMASGGAYAALYESQASQYR